MELSIRQFRAILILTLIALGLKLLARPFHVTGWPEAFIRWAGVCALAFLSVEIAVRLIFILARPHQLASMNSTAGALMLTAVSARLERTGIPTGAIVCLVFAAAAALLLMDRLAARRPLQKIASERKHGFEIMGILSRDAASAAHSLIPD